MKKEKNINVVELAENIKIDIGLSGSLPTADYENLKPYYNFSLFFNKRNLGDVSVKEVIQQSIQELKEKANDELDKDFLRAKRKKIESARGDVRFQEIDGKTYVHVTSALNPFGIEYDPFLLSQYASRGTIVHKIAEEYIKSLISIQEQEKSNTYYCLECKKNHRKTSKIGKEHIEHKKKEEPKLINPREVKELEEDIKTIESGGLGLTWTDCNVKGFIDKYRKKIDLSNAKIEEPIKNDRYLYVGTPDLVAKYDGVKAVLDWKTSSSYSGEKGEKFFMQLSAYAKCVGAKRLVICPLKPKNKSGYGKPIIEDRVDHYFKKFVAKRKQFRDIFGF